jgi:type IV pilus assembly protein PilF
MNMAGGVAGRALAMRALALMGAAGALALALGGCASPPASGTTAAADIVTPSDESETRRRARIRLELASGYFEEGKTEVALDETKQALAIDPSFAEAYDMRGLILMRLNDLRGAEDSFRRAIAISPREANVHHNLGWLLCQQGRYAEAQTDFDVAMASPLYNGRAKTLMAQGVCQARAGQLAEAEKSLARSYELDPGNPITGYNLARLLYRRGENARAQFYIRRINNSELANAESLWLGIKVERRMNDTVAMRQLGEQLKKRFGSTREASAYERGAFDE